jgi:formylglycine-generating enzyme required for sulfatase activity
VDQLNALIDGLAEAPYELDRWAVLSDWLEDQEDFRAELVRLTAWLEANAVNPFVLAGQPCHTEYALIRQRAYELIILGGMNPIRPTRQVAGMDFVWVPPGLFERGENRHIVMISRGFWMARTQVTQAQWQTVMGSNPSHFKGDPQRPVEMVSWHDCQEFCKRMSQATGSVVQLPTEAQWEWACRGTTTTRFYSGDTEADLKRVGWYWGNSDGKTHPVAQLRPNLWGLFDMHGNVWEWCQDWYGGYSLEGAVPLQEALGRLCVCDPERAKDDHFRVIRGGCVASDVHRVQADCADCSDRPSFLPGVGFRPCVCDPAGPEQGMDGDEVIVIRGDSGISGGGWGQRAAEDNQYVSRDIGCRPCLIDPARTEEATGHVLYGGCWANADISILQTNNRGWNTRAYRYDGFRPCLIDPGGAGEGYYREMRGGSLGNVAKNCRSGCRGNPIPTCGFAFIGFRPCLIDPGGPTQGVLHTCRGNSYCSSGNCDPSETDTKAGPSLNLSFRPCLL